MTYIHIMGFLMLWLNRLLVPVYYCITVYTSNTDNSKYKVKFAIVHS